MAQVKIFGNAPHLDKVKAQLSDVTHECIVEALQFPQNKRAHRFFPIGEGNMIPPEGRSDAYTILEFTMIRGRNRDTKKHLVKLLYERIKQQVGIVQQDLEICIYECPAENWGFRGKNGDEITLDYKVEV